MSSILVTFITGMTTIIIIANNRIVKKNQLDFTKKEKCINISNLDLIPAIWAEKINTRHEHVAATGTNNFFRILIRLFFYWSKG